MRPFSSVIMSRRPSPDSEEAGECLHARSMHPCGTPMRVLYSPQGDLTKLALPAKGGRCHLEFDPICATKIYTLWPQRSEDVESSTSEPTNRARPHARHSKISCKQRAEVHFANFASKG